MSCCGSSRAKKKPTQQVVIGYRTTSKTKVFYHGVETIKINGHYTGNRYIFVPGMEKEIDSNDAMYLKGVPGFTVNEI